MPDVREYQSVMDEAEQAARAGDFARANTRLREALALQETTLGASHPDLASTLNNLAVVCETLGDLPDAERFYRRAYAIASGSLPPDDPLVVTSRENLKDFCAARGLALDVSSFADGGDAVRAAEASLPARAAPAPPAAAPLRVDTPAPVASSPRTARTAPVAPAPAPPAADVPAGRRSLRALAVVGALALVGAFAIFRSGPASGPEQGRDTAPAAPAPETVPPAATPSPAPSAATPLPPERTAPTAEAPAAPTAAAPTPPRDAPPPAAVERPRDPAPANAGASGIRIVTANVCASLRTSGAWRCDAVGATTAPGRAAFYTRLASPRPIRVSHRWYQGDRLRQDVTLSIGANASAGYRTFSRQTLTRGPWRVELRAPDGQVLYETAFDVR